MKNWCLVGNVARTRLRPAVSRSQDLCPWADAGVCVSMSTEWGCSLRILNWVRALLSHSALGAECTDLYTLLLKDRCHAEHLRLCPHACELCTHEGEHLCFMPGTP